MFHDIRPSTLARMQYLESIDAQDRLDGTPRLKRLRQITPETGRFLALLLAGAPEGAVLEIGTSAGYSTMWLALACERQQRQIVTFIDHQETLKPMIEKALQDERVDALVVPIGKGELVCRKV